MMSAAATEKAIRDRAVDYACPTCGAKAGIRCPTVRLRRFDARPCPERTALASRAMLAEGLDVMTRPPDYIVWSPETAT